MNTLRRFLSSFFLSLIDLFRESYTYHSGALTYHFMLTMAPLTIVLLNLLSFLPMVDMGELERVVDRLFPQYTNRVIHEILEVQRRSKETSFIALGISYFFSVGFIKYVGRALSFVSEGRMGEKKEIFYWLFMPIFLLAVVAVISAYFFLSIYIKLVVPRTYSLIADASSVIPMTLILFLVYVSFLKEGIGLLKLMLVSLLVSLIMLSIQFGFTWYIAHLFKGSLLYGSLSAVVVFLLWVNLIFLTMLFGGRLIYRLKES